MDNSLISQVVSSLTMLAHKVHRDINSNTGEVENLFFYSDKSEEEWIRLSFQPYNEDNKVLIMWSKTVYIDDDTKAIVCHRPLKDWSDFCTILQVAKAGIFFCQ